MLVGKQLGVRASVVLGDLSPSDVEVQLIHGLVILGEFVHYDIVSMKDGEWMLDGGSLVSG